MRKTWFEPGQWNAICDECGFKFKSGQLRKRWDGDMVCRKDWEPRQPLDFLKLPAPRPPIPWSRPDNSETYVEPPTPTGNIWFDVAPPNTGAWAVGITVFNSNASVAEQGITGSKYIVAGWKRATSNPTNVLGVDWIEIKKLTGN